MAQIFKPKAKPTLAKSLLKMSIDKLDINGVGIARWQNKPLFIQGALPGELVTVKVFEQKNKFAKGKLIDVITASENRVKPACKHFGFCGGCDLQMLDLESQLLFKQQKIDELFSRSFSQLSLSKNQNVLPLPWCEPIKSEPWNYRRKARIGVQFDKKSHATIGFRQKATNQLAAIKSCPVLAKPLDDIFPLLQNIVGQLKVTSAIGHIEVILADLTKKVAVDTKGDELKQSSHLAANSNESVVIVIRQLKAMNHADIDLWHTFAQEYHWHILVDDGNTQSPLINNSAVKTTHLSYSLADNTQIYFDSYDFIQINHQVNIRMIEQALTWLNLEVNDKVLDLFCGLGNFSLAIANRVKHVVGVEGVQVMVDKATQNARLNHIDNCEFYQADLNGHWLLSPWASEHTYDKILLDPARAGAEQAVEQIAKLRVPQVLYVSCDPSTLARDAAILTSAGYKMEKISLMDMFSQTKHVETMVLFIL